MNWKYRLKRLVTNRFSLSAALFLAVIVFGAFSALFGVLDNSTACTGFAQPSLLKQDPSLPHHVAAYRSLSAGALNAPAPIEEWPDRFSQKPPPQRTPSRPPSLTSVPSSSSTAASRPSPAAQ